MKAPAARWRLLLAAAALVAASFAAFGPALRAGFIFDDRWLIVDNAGVAGLDLARLRWMLSTNYLTTFMPLGWLLFAAIRASRGLSPAAFHAAGLLLHGLVATAFFEACRRLLRAAGQARADGPAFAAALLFCVHPFMTSSAGWATELPDLASTLLFLCAVAVYLGGRSRARLTAVFLLYLLALLFRWKAVSLPIVLLVLDFWPLRRRAWLEKAPFFVLAAAAAALTAAAKSRIGYAAAWMPAASCRGLLLYCGALLWPFEQRALYALQSGGDALGVPAALAVALVAAVTALLWLRRRSWPAALGAWVCYAAAVAPPSLHAQGPFMFVFLPYGYLGALPLFALASLGLVRLGRRGPKVLAAVTAAAALALGFYSRRESAYWRTGVSFWTHAVAVDRDCAVCRAELGHALLEAGRLNDAWFVLNAQLLYNPADPVAVDNMARLRAAAPDLAPDLPSFWISEAGDFLALGRAGDAKLLCARALAKRPLWPAAQERMARAQEALGDRPAAERHRRAAQRSVKS